MKKICLYQGDYSKLGSAEEVADKLSQFDCAVLTHLVTITGEIWKNGKCIDTAYPDMARMVQLLKQKNPAISLYGYISATADNPKGCWVNPAEPYDCPEGICSDFVRWFRFWDSLEESIGFELEGIYIDMVNQAYISPYVRDNCFSYVKYQGKKIMANILTETVGDVAFAADSFYFRAGDSLLIEGWYADMGVVSAYKAHDLGCLLLRYIYNKGIEWVALATEESGILVDPMSDNCNNAKFLAELYSASAFWYQGADLGTMTGSIVI